MNQQTVLHQGVSLLVHFIRLQGGRGEMAGPCGHIKGRGFSLGVPVTVAEMALCVTLKAGLEKAAPLLSGSLTPRELALHPSRHAVRKPSAAYTWEDHPETPMQQERDAPRQQPADLWAGQPSDDSSPSLGALKVEQRHPFPTRTHPNYRFLSISTHSCCLDPLSCFFFFW